jgi:hypothetical protein
MVMLEDVELRLSFLWLSRYVSDANDAFGTLTFSLEGVNHFHFALDVAKQQLRIWPDLHWSGIEPVVLNVSDPIGLSAQDTFSIQVLQVPNSPDKFNLLSPQDEISLPYENAPVEFIWEHSWDPDPRDKVSYSFFMSSSSNLSGSGTLVISSIPDTSVSLVLNNPDGTYYWAVRADDKEGNQTWSNQVFITTIKSGVDDSKNTFPTRYDLSQNFPNTFNPSTAFSCQLPRPGWVTIRIFDTKGCMVRTLVNGRLNAGTHRIDWDGRNEENRYIGSGVYVVQMRAEDFVQYRKMMLIR